MFPVSSESTRETIALNSSMRLVVIPQLHGTKHEAYYTSGGFTGGARRAIAPPPGNLKEYKKLNVLI